MPTIVALSAIVIAYMAATQPRTAVLLICALIPTYLFRFEIAGVLPVNYVEVLILSALAASLFLGLALRRYSMPSPLTLVAVVLLVTGLAIGVLVAPVQTVALGIVKGWFVIPVLFALYIVRHTRASDLPNLMMALVLGAVPLAVATVYQPIAHSFITIDGRASAWFSSPNYPALYIGPLLILALALLTHYWKNKLMRYIAVGVAALFLAALIATQSLTSIAAVLLGGALFVYFWAKSMWPRIASRLISASLITTTLLLAGAVYQRAHDLLNLTSRSSASVRLQVWHAAGTMIQDHWLTGIGLGGFYYHYPQYVQRLYNPPLEWSILHSHNLGLEIWLGLGLAGLIGFLILVVQWLYLGYRQTASLVGAGLFAALVTILAQGVTDLPYFKNDLSLLFCVLIACLYVQANSLQHRN